MSEATTATPLEQLKADPYWQNIEGMCQMNDVPVVTIEDELARLVNEPFLAVVPDGLTRWKQAALIIYARHNRDTIIKVEPYNVRVLSVEAPRTITKKTGEKMRLASLQAFIQGTKPQAKLALGQVTFYDANADNVQGIEEGKTYRVLLSGAFRDGSYQLTADRRAKWDTLVDGDATPVNDLIQRIYPRVDAIDIGKFVAKTIQVRGNVVFSMVRPTKKGGTFGKYTIIDESLSPDAISQGGAIQVMCNAEQVKYGPGSDIIIIGQVTRSAEYGIGMNAKMVIPVLAVPVEELEPNGYVGGPAINAVDFSEFEEA